MAALDRVVGSTPPFALVPSPEQLTRVMQQIVEEAFQAPEAFTARRAAGPAWIKQYYTPDKIMIAWRYLYEALLGQHPWPEPKTPFLLNPRFIVRLDKLPDIVF